MDMVQKGSVATVALFFGGVLFYQFTPKKGDETSLITGLISKYTSRAEDWEEINALHTKAMEQAGFDRNLFENVSNKHRFVDVAYPEYASTPLSRFPAFPDVYVLPMGAEPVLGSTCH